MTPKSPGSKRSCTLVPGSKQTSNKPQSLPSSPRLIRSGKPKRVNGHQDFPLRPAGMPIRTTGGVYTGEMEPPERDSRPAPRQPGWVPLLGTLGVACLTVGLVLLTLILAPVFRPRLIVAAGILAAAGFAMLVTAWLGRRRAR